MPAWSPSPPTYLAFAVVRSAAHASSNSEPSDGASDGDRFAEASRFRLTRTCSVLGRCHVHRFCLVLYFLYLAAGSSVFFSIAQSGGPVSSAWGGLAERACQGISTPRRYGLNSFVFLNLLKF